ncbi:MAG: hypothetical protein JL56_06020 [Desulfotomaculum sp. BICA1-6]|nr:MAG: hypothetical protein VR67_08605 [Peptococcaceae bacterium BRH_c8a]KJS76092.1 MAG: hypothetical protein JL56_06020 [Desulfotomaculum sp. BICA1-6]
MSKEVFEKAMALGVSIVESEEFKEIQKREDDIIKDANAQVLLKRFHELQNKQREMTKKGEFMTDEEVIELEKTQLKMVENKTVKSFSAAQEKFQAMMNQVMKIIRDAGVQKNKE